MQLPTVMSPKICKSAMPVAFPADNTITLVGRSARINLSHDGLNIKDDADLFSKVLSHQGGHANEPQVAESTLTKMDTTMCPQRICIVVDLCAVC